MRLFGALLLLFTAKTDEKVDQNVLQRYVDSGRIITSTRNGEPVLVASIFGADGSLEDCEVLQGRQPVDQASKVLPKAAVRPVTEGELRISLAACSNLHGTSGRGRSAAEKTWVIYPGTKWCGDGNVAENDDDLGESQGTDSCCRNHDRAPDKILARATKHGIVNSRNYTISHCDDDWKFFNCLKDEGSEASREVGHLYFDILAPVCFARAPPYECKEYYTSAQGVCREHFFNLEKPLRWQTFWTPTFAERDLTQGCPESEEGGPPLLPPSRPDHQTVHRPGRPGPVGARAPEGIATRPTRGTRRHPGLRPERVPSRHPGGLRDRPARRRHPPQGHSD
ncbi:phospholipase A2 hemilipin-like isoform X2 [Ornithodoros turicata]